MLVTKALVTEIPSEDNYYTVRVPLFEDTSGTEITYRALCCHTPGVFGGLNVGDCVYIAFEDAKLNVPVIIGRLYTREFDEYAKGYFNNLNVTSVARLPLNTMIGDVSMKALFDSVYNTVTSEGSNYPKGAVCQVEDGEDPRTI